ncbi:restriction endonuclease subunit S [Lactobacillus delbrueckii subsp. lactis]|uniref:restriction endonuclease subunit S n=1 Tax=Lactobacillus delbrueckii TaxID=1584 RepID=UPI0035CF4F6D
MKQIPWSSLSARSCRNRRKGCNFAWEQCKLGDVAKITMGQSPNSKNYTDNPKDHILVQGNADMKDGQVHPRIWTTEITKIADKGDLILSVRAPVGDIGKTSYDVVIGRGVAAIKGNEFIFQLLKRMKTVGYWTKYSTGSTFESINSLEINNAVINLPKEHEQNKVGKILSYMDHAITLHEEKKRQLERLKSALLKKMFADKSGYPVVRFKEFCDEWQGTKLRKISKIVRGASPRPISDPKWFDNDSNVGWLRISDVTSQDGRIHHLKQHISKQGQAKTRVISEPHLLLSIAATVGKPLINYVKIGVHDGFLIFIEPQFDLEFMFQWLEMFRPQWSKYGQPGSQINLNSDLVKNQIIYLPSREEQNQIGIFLNQIDSLINLHQQKINNINSVKKSLLQKMFI